MINDDENKNGAGFTGGAPSSGNLNNPQEEPVNANANSANPQPPTAGQEPDPRGRTQAPNVYYEPWQEPVNRQAGAPGQEPFSPGIHSGSYYMHQRAPIMEQPPAPQKKGRSGLIKAVCLVLVCAVVSAGATYGVIQFSGSNNSSSHQVILGSSSAPGTAAAQSKPTTLTSTGDTMSAEDIYTMAQNQVVGVNSEAKTNVFGQVSSSPVSGSGFIVSADGYIVTNYHVIQYADTQKSTLTVMTHDGKSYPAKIIGYDQDNDIAVIKIDATGLSAVTLGTNKDMKVGDQVYAVGNPLGELTYTMTSGIVSALDRTITEEDGSGINMFQIDAAVNPGNSGGPVYNAKGEVIGIVSAKYASTGVEGLGFAIPIDDASNIVTQLISNGHVSGKPSMGITVKDVTSSAAQYYNLVVGAYVNSVTSGSAADKAGLKVGDIITKLGDTTVTDTGSLKTAKNKFKAGDTTTLVVHRDGKDLTLKITFDETGVTPTSSQTQPSFGNNSRGGSAN